MFASDRLTACLTWGHLDTDKGQPASQPAQCVGRTKGQVAGRPASQPLSSLPLTELSQNADAIRYFIVSFIEKLFSGASKTLNFQRDSLRSGRSWPNPGLVRELAAEAAAAAKIAAATAA